MKSFVVSRLDSFEQHLRQTLRGELEPRIIHSPRILLDTVRDQPAVVLVHAPSFPSDLPSILEMLSSGTRLAVGVAAERPNLEEMLTLTRFGIRAYFNSYMTDVHYEHLLTLLGSGQTWFSPGLLGRALELARDVMQRSKSEDLLDALTLRECEIAHDVAQGLSNKRIANARDISESTVKTHLTRIFKKLEIADRTSLAIRLRESA